jgi:hypothetical protein
MMYLARATHDGNVYSHPINAQRPDRWRHKDGVTVIESDRKTAIAVARFLAMNRPEGKVLIRFRFTVQPMSTKDLAERLQEQSRRIAAELFI